MGGILFFIGLLGLIIIVNFMINNKSAKIYEEHAMSQRANNNFGKEVCDLIPEELKTYNPRTDGLYIYVHSAKNQHGEVATFYFSVLFNKNGLVLVVESDKMPTEENICSLIDDFKDITETDEYITKYNNKGILSFIVKKSLDNEEVYTGKVLKNGLRLSYSNYYYSEWLDSKTNKSIFKDAHFSFISVSWD
jgi:hypothetical protein